MEKFKKNDSPFDFQQYRKSPEPLMMKSIVEKYRPLHYLGENYRTNINICTKASSETIRKTHIPPIVSLFPFRIIQLGNVLL